MTYIIKDSQFKNETFTIESTEDMGHLELIAADLVKYGKETIMYTMKRIIEGTRKKSYTVSCWRFAGTDTFISIA